MICIEIQDYQIIQLHLVETIYQHRSRKLSMKDACWSLTVCQKCPHHSTLMLRKVCLLARLTGQIASPTISTEHTHILVLLVL